MTTSPATYEGRPLPRPDEELVDQGVQFDLATLLGRRRALTLLGLGVAGGALAACGSPSTPSTSTTATSTTATTTAATGGSALTEIPEETAGPYPGDGSNGPDVLEQSGVVRSDIRSSFGTSTTTAPGVPMALTLTVLDLAGGGAPLAGAAVYAWHCTADGRYSMYSQGVEQENFLRGVQVTDARGEVTFQSIVPGCYSGRWPHVHFEVYPDQASITDASSALATSQVALPQDLCDAVYATSAYSGSSGNLARLSLTSDMVFGDDGGVHQLGTATGDTAEGYAVRLTVPVR